MNGVFTYQGAGGLVGEHAEGLQGVVGQPDKVPDSGSSQMLETLHGTQQVGGVGRGKQEDDRPKGEKIRGLFIYLYNTPPNSRP